MLKTDIICLFHPNTGVENCTFIGGLCMHSSLIRVYKPRLGEIDEGVDDDSLINKIVSQMNFDELTEMISYFESKHLEARINMRRASKKDTFCYVYGGLLGITACICVLVLFGLLFGEKSALFVSLIDTFVFAGVAFGAYKRSKARMLEPYIEEMSVCEHEIARLNNRISQIDFYD